MLGPDDRVTGFHAHVGPGGHRMPAGVADGRWRLFLGAKTGVRRTGDTRGWTRWPRERTRRGHRRFWGYGSASWSTGLLGGLQAGSCGFTAMRADDVGPRPGFGRPERRQFRGPGRGKSGHGGPPELSSSDECGNCFLGVQSLRLTSHVQVRHSVVEEGSSTSLAGFDLDHGISCLSVGALNLNPLLGVLRTPPEVGFTGFTSEPLIISDLGSCRSGLGSGWVQVGFTGFTIKGSHLGS